MSVSFPYTWQNIGYWLNKMKYNKQNRVQTSSEN